MAALMNSPVAVSFPNTKVHDYVLTLLTDAKIDWKDAQLHNIALESMSRAEIVPPPPEQAPQKDETVQ